MGKNSRYLLGLGVGALLVSAGCQKNIDVSQVQRKELAVVVEQRPKAYVWSMERGMASAVLFGMIGAVADIAINESLGLKFSKIMADYPVEEKLAGAVAEKLNAAGFENPVLICTEGMQDGDQGCKDINDLAGLKQGFPGSQVLVVRPCEWGLRNDTPYLCITYKLFDLSSEKQLFTGAELMKNEEIQSPPVTLKNMEAN